MAGRGLPALDVARVQRWCAAQVPQRLRGEIRVECGIAARHLTICECRPPWQERTSAPNGPGSRSHACTTPDHRPLDAVLARPEPQVPPLPSPATPVPASRTSSTTTPTPSSGDRRKKAPPAGTHPQGSGAGWGVRPGGSVPVSSSASGHRVLGSSRRVGAGPARDPSSGRTQAHRPSDPSRIAASPPAASGSFVSVPVAGPVPVNLADAVVGDPATAADTACLDNTQPQLIVVSLVQQRAWMCAGARQMYTTPVSTGQVSTGQVSTGDATPTGSWTIDDRCGQDILQSTHRAAPPTGKPTRR